MIATTISQKFRRLLITGGGWLVLAYLVLPMTIILPVSLTDQKYLSLPKETMSLKHYAAFFHDPVWIASTIQSLIIAVFATIVAVLLGALCTIGCWRLGGRLSANIRLLMLAPLIIPTIVQAVGMYRMWAWLGLYDTYLGIVIAHAIIGMPYVMVTTSASLATIDAKLEQAARSLGATTSQTVRLVILPGITPGLLSGALFAFASSFDELIIVLFLTTRDITTLPKRIYEGIEEDVDPTIAAASMLLVVLTLAFVIISLILKRRGEARQSASAAIEKAA